MDKDYAQSRRSSTGLSVVYPRDLRDMTVDEELMRRQRIARVRDQLRRDGFAAALLFEPANVRYCTVNGAFSVYNLHCAFRWALVPVESDPVLWEYAPALFIARERWPEGDIRVAATGFQFFGSGNHYLAEATRFAEMIVAELAERGISGELLGVDRLDTSAFLALQHAGVSIGDVQRSLEVARSVKTSEEVKAMRAAAQVCDAAIDDLREAIRPGRTESELWAIFVAAAFQRGAEFVETRLLTSGPRTNPWNREASDRVVKDGELVAFDTDLVGPFGYLTDISRTYLCGGKRPTDEQRDAYRAAYDFIQSCLPELRPGRSFEELGEVLSRRLPKEYHRQRYLMIAHGTGLLDEYPALKYAGNHSGVIEAGMVLSVEAYAGRAGGHEGVKLEEQILVTASGYEIFSRSPYEDRLRE